MENTSSRPTLFKRLKRSLTRKPSEPPVSQTTEIQEIGAFPELMMYMTRWRTMLENSPYLSGNQDILHFVNLYLVRQPDGTFLPQAEKPKPNYDGQTLSLDVHAKFSTDSSFPHAEIRIGVNSSSDGPSIIDPVNNSRINSVSFNVDTTYLTDQLDPAYSRRFEMEVASYGGHSNVWKHTLSYKIDALGKKIVRVLLSENDKKDWHKDDLSEDHAKALCGLVDNILTQALTTESLQVEEPTTKEQEGSSHWNYSQLQEHLRQVVLSNDELREEIFPSYIDFGEVAANTEGLTTIAQRSRPIEYSQTLGITTQSSLIFSPIDASGNSNNIVIKGFASFPSEIEEQLQNLVAVAHNHLRRKVFNPDDLLPLLTLQGRYPLLSLSAPGSQDGPGFILFAMRTNQTPLLPALGITQQALDAKVRELQKNLQEDEYLKALSLRSNWLARAGIFTPLHFSEQEVRELNAIDDDAIRYLAKKYGLMFYIAPFGNTVGKKCNLDRPLLSQIPPKMIE